MNVGVSQGNILAPILFIIYTNGLYKELKYNEEDLFEDDIAIVTLHKTLKRLK